MVKKKVDKKKEIHNPTGYYPGMENLVWNTMPVEYCKVEVLRPQQGTIIMEFKNRTVNEIGQAVEVLSKVTFGMWEIGRILTEEERKKLEAEEKNATR